MIRFGWFLIILILSSCLLACNETTTTNNNNINNTNNTNSNNTNNTNNTNNNNINNTTPGTCTAEDLVFQSQCNTGYKCTIYNTQKQVGCIEDNGPLSVGAACAPVSSGRTQDGCPRGSFCYQNSTATGFCRMFCPIPYVPCDETSLCYEPVAVSGGATTYLCMPTDNCDPLQPASCSTGQCYVYISGNYQTKCEPAGTLLKDQPCAKPSDCAPQHTCYEGVCRYLCTRSDECGIDICQYLSAHDPYGLCL